MEATPKQYATAWRELTEGKNKNEASEVAKKLFLHLYKTGRMNIVPKILREAEEADRKKQGAEKVTITTAEEINEKQAMEIASAVTGKKNIILKQKINPKLIKGAQIETTDNRWDLSIKNQLDQLSRQLQK